MRPIKASVVLAGFVLLLFDASWIRSAVPELTISGTLFSENGGDLSCDRCLISLLANGVRPVATAFLDLGGHFSFRGVPRGSYTIHAEIDGFEDVNQPVDAHEGLEPNVTINLVRRASRPRSSRSSRVASSTAWRPSLQRCSMNSSPDASSRWWFRAYWLVVRPFSGRIRRSWLRAAVR